MRIIGLILLLLFAENVFAQPPLSKRDEKRKAEFEAQIAAEEKYDELMEIADAAFKGKDYVKARMTYNEAIQYNDEKAQWLTSKVNDLDILMAKRAAREVDSILVRIDRKEITMPEENAEAIQIESRQMERSKPSLQEVEEEDEPEKPQRESGTENTGVVVAKNVEMKPKKVEEKPSKAESPKEAMKEKVKEDFSAYPGGISEETFNLTNQTVLRIVVKDGMEVKVFKRVQHNWGGEFYFLDDISVTQRYWQEEVARFRDKFGETTDEN